MKNIRKCEYPFIMDFKYWIITLKLLKRFNFGTKKFIQHSSCFSLIFSIIFLGSDNQYAIAQNLEKQIKAAQLFNFPKFIDWPEETFISADEPFIFSVIGDEELAEIMEEVVDSIEIKGRNIAFNYVDALENIEICHVMFIGVEADREIDKILNKASEWSTLTVSDKPGFINKGGIINFVIKNNRVRFELNITAAKKAGLKPDARLLDLAILKETEF